MGLIHFVGALSMHRHSDENGPKPIFTLLQRPSQFSRFDSAIRFAASTAPLGHMVSFTDTMEDKKSKSTAPIFPNQFARAIIHSSSHQAVPRFRQLSVIDMLSFYPRRKLLTALTSFFISNIAFARV
jgi:hypothetical protein